MANPRAAPSHFTRKRLNVTWYSHMPAPAPANAYHLRFPSFMENSSTNRAKAAKIQYRKSSAATAMEACLTAVLRIRKTS